MTKSFLTGIAICTTLAVFAGNAYGYKAPAHKTQKIQRTTTTSTTRPLPNGARVNTSPRGEDLLYKACEEPWRHPEYVCPGTGGEGG